MTTGRSGRTGKGKDKRRKRPSLPPAERASTARSRVPRAAVRTGAWAAMALALAAGTWLLVVYPSLRGPGSGHSVEVTLQANPSPARLGAQLAEAGVLARPRLFALWLTMTGGCHVAEGVHLVTDDASPRELVSRLERRGGGQSLRVTFPEGWTRFDMARRIEE